MKKSSLPGLKSISVNNKPTDRGVAKVRLEKARAEFERRLDRVLNEGKKK